jgi:uroporphyrinogen decarboxylase
VDKLWGISHSAFCHSKRNYKRRNLSILIQEKDLRTTSSAATNRSFQAALIGKVQQIPPLWMMRQAGRYLPEYKEIRKTAKNFLHFCYSPELAIEATMQPIRRFDFDASIIFSDILTIPDALGRNVRFLEGEGPHMDPIEDPKVIDALEDCYQASVLDPTYVAVSGVRDALPKTTALIGFCGAPWTIATYMIAGKGTKEQAPARLFAYRYPEAFQKLINLLVKLGAEHLIKQIDAGADTVQIFDSWAAVLPEREFETWSVQPIKALVKLVRSARPQAKIIAFPRGATTGGLIRFAFETAVDGLSLDTADDLSSLAVEKNMPTLQGNLDPLVLIAGGKALDQAIDHILGFARTRPFIFNLGHGILPETPVAHVEHLVRRVRQQSIET